MAFDQQQERKLRAKLRARHIRTRQVEDRSFDYLEGWHVIAEANRIFGFDGWERETQESRCVYTKQNGNRYTAAYVARIRITVHAGDRRIVRDGSGAGEATTDSPGSAHEMALKAAETDATKRALVTFGNPFGLSLYSGAPNQQEDTTGRSADSQNSNQPETLEHRNLRDRSDAPEGAVNGAVNGHSARSDASGLTWPKGRQPGKISKSELPIGEPHRVRDSAHLRYVASRPCVVCGKSRTHAHHLTYTQPRALGRKVSDEFTIPLCSKHHQELHLSGNEQRWWADLRIDPLPIARQLWERSAALSLA